MPDKKLHRQRPLFVQAKGFGGRNILFFYAWRVVQQLGQRRGLLTSGRVHNEGHRNTFLRRRPDVTPQRFPFQLRNQN